MSHSTKISLTSYRNPTSQLVKGEKKSAPMHTTLFQLSHAMPKFAYQLLDSWQTWHCKAQSAPDYNQKHTFLPPPRGYVLRCVCMSARVCKDTENGKWKGRLGKERSTNLWKPSWVAWLKEISSTVADTQTLERITRISKSDSECTTVYVGLSIAADTAIVVITIKIMNLSHPLATTSMASSGLLSAKIP